MTKTILKIDKITQRRFILGQQGLYPGRRYRGQEGAAAAMQAGAVVQMDPLNIIARSHDLALFGRVLDYTPAHLDALQFKERQFFDYGGTLFVHPMRELPYWRTTMQRKAQEPSRQEFVSQYQPIIDEVYQAVAANGPQAGRDFKSETSQHWTYRSRKASGQALYHLWISGELMTHSRVHFQRLLDLRSRIAPAELDTIAPEGEAEAYFARRIFHKMGLLTERGFRGWWQGDCQRTIGIAEARQRLEQLLQTTTVEEMVPLAPLEICTARGRAKPLFDFDYVWEVYKPAEKRRWGYYTLPLLYADRLAGRMDASVQRAAAELHLLGLWVEPGEVVDEAYRAALAAGLRRLMKLCMVETLVCTAGVPGKLAGDLEERCNH